MTAKIIVFEGNDGVGKSTQAQLLTKKLDRAVYVKSPFYTKSDNGYTRKAIQFALASGLAVQEPKSFQKLFVDNRNFFVENTLKTLRLNHRYIIIDRWNLSTYIYGQDINDPDYILPLLKSNLEVDLQIIMIGKSFRSKPLDDLEKKAYEIQERYIKYMVSENHIEGLPKNNVYISVTSGKIIEDIHSEILNAIKEQKL